MKKSLLAISASALLLGASATSFAAQPYLIGQLGKSDFDVDGYDDDSDTYFSIGVGFDISKNLAFEASYKDFGEADVGRGRFDDSVSVEASAFSAAAVGKLPLNASFELIGKVGLDLWDVEAEPGDDDDGFDLFLGFGAAFNVDSRMDITATYELHEFDDVDVDVVAIGINYGF
jgi:opacity protein-like surface antigen